MLRDNGNGGDVDIQIDPNGVSKRNHMFEFDVVLNSSLTGKFINVKVQAFNAMGFTTSRANLLILADVPGKPYPGPIVDSS